MNQLTGLSDAQVSSFPAVRPSGAGLIQSALAELHDTFSPLTDGAVADYIPELAKANPDHFGICAVTTDGAVYAIGDAEVPFTIQSISKAFVYGLALEDHGLDGVLRRVGVEPSGEPFNAIEFDQRSNRPFNPMVNAGAIATTALVQGSSPAARLERIRSMFERYCGRPLSVDDRVFASERETGHRNRAIAYLMLNGGMIDEPIVEHLDLYFQQCAILVSARDLAMMAATLAAGGRNPLTGEQAIGNDYVRRVIAVMSSCGMYDYSGEWSFRIGLPAKSGVGGGVVAVLPGQLGIGVFSPPLDDNGNSVRGIAVCEEFSRRFGLHLFDPQTAFGHVVRRSLTADVLRSNRIREPKSTAILDARGRSVYIAQLQGNLYFGAVERLLRTLDDVDEPIRHLILDLRHVGHIDGPAARLLAHLTSAYAEDDRSLQICLSTSAHEMRAVLRSSGLTESQFCTDLDSGLESAEDRLLAEAAHTEVSKSHFDFGEQELFADLDVDDLAFLAAAAQPVEFRAGDTIIREGDAADRLYLLARGSVSVRVSLGGGRSKRLAKMNAGVAFGEMALLSDAARTADIVADEEVECYVIGAETIAELAARRPAIHAALLGNLGRLLAERLRRANNEIRMLEV